MDQIVTVGRRKTSVARVFLRQSGAGKGSLTVNNREFEDFFPIDFLRIKILEPFSTLEISPADFDIKVNVHGGGVTGQAEALRMGIARALIQVDPEYRSDLKRNGLLTRDSRMVERKKYGQPKARKKTQFSKR